MVPREAHGTIYTHAGPEIGVASTKTFTAQLTALFLFALYIAEKRGQLTTEQERNSSRRLRSCRANLKRCWHVKKSASTWPDLLARKRFSVSRPRHSLSGGTGRRAEDEEDFLHSRRGLSGRRDEARAHRADRRWLAGGGDRHLRQERSRVGSRYERTISNIKEVKARSGKVIALVTEGDGEIAELADHVICVPQHQNCCRPYWKSCRSNCLRTTLRYCAGATSISREIWRSPSRWSKGQPFGFPRVERTAVNVAYVSPHVADTTNTALSGRPLWFYRHHHDSV